MFLIPYTLAFCVFIHTSLAHFSNFISKDNKNHLVNIIKTLNGDDDGTDAGTDDGSRKDDHDLNDDEKEEILQEILRLLKKNYKTSAKQIANPIRDEARLYFIRNPEVLDEYKNYLMAKISSPINYNPSGDLSGYKYSGIKDDLKEIEKAILSLDKDQLSDYESADLGNAGDIQDSRKYNLRRGKIFKGKYNLRSDDNNDSLDAQNKRFKKRNKDRYYDDVKLKIDMESSSDEGINRRPFGKTVRNKLKSNKINRKESIHDFKSKIKNVESNKHKSNIVYRKPLNEKVGFSFGRTHIPVIVKQGIYEDK